VRLHRSLEKIAAPLPGHFSSADWQLLLDSYFATQLEPLQETALAIL
jgi:hypothetical protein